MLFKPTTAVLLASFFSSALAIASNFYISINPTVGGAVYAGNTPIPDLPNSKLISFFNFSATDPALSAGPKLGPISVTKPLDRFSPRLAQVLDEGIIFNGEIIADIGGTAGSNGLVAFDRYTWKITNGTLRSYEQWGDTTADTPLWETFSMTYQKLGFITQFADGTGESVALK